MPAINTTALPDIIFMLLFFFMVSTVMRQPDSTDQLVLPNTITSESTERTNPNELVISLFSDASNTDIVKIQNQITPIENIQKILDKVIIKMKKKHLSPEKAILKIDQHVNMSTVNKLKTALQKAEVLQIEYVHQAGTKSLG